MATFVLIPGAGGVAWYFGRLVPLLEVAGHRAVAVDLPGADRSAGLAEYADLVVRACQGADDLVLVAQSLGGFTTEFDLFTYFLHDVDPAVAAEGEPYQRPEAEIVFGGRCDFDRWPDIPIRVLAGADDRLFPAEFQRRVAKERLGVEADVLPGGHLIALSNAPAVADYLLAAAT